MVFDALFGMVQTDDRRGKVDDGNSLYILFSQRGHFVGTVLFCVDVDHITFLKQHPALSVLSVLGPRSACFQQCRLRRSLVSAGQATFSGSTQPSVVAGSSRTRRLPLPVGLAPATFRTFWRLQVALGPTHAPHKARLRRRFLFPSDLKRSRGVSVPRHRSAARVLAASSFGSASASVSSAPLAPPSGSIQQHHQFRFFPAVPPPPAASGFGNLNFTLNSGRASGCTSPPLQHLESTPSAPGASGNFQFPLPFNNTPGSGNALGLSVPYSFSASLASS